jgi:DNA polymerase-3 subunit beta
MTTTKGRRAKTRSGGIALELNAGTISDALGIVKPAAAGDRSPKPVLRNVLISNGLVVATDLEMRIETELFATSTGTVLLPLERLQAILRTVSPAEQVTFTVNDSSCVIEAGAGRWTIPTEDPAEFPTWDTDVVPLARIPADQFSRAVRGVIYAVDADSSRYALGAVLIEVAGGAVTFVSTDGRRLSTFECETDQAVDDSTTLVPARALQQLERLAADSDGAVQMERSASEFVATLDGTTLTARLVDGTFPKWRQVIPARKAASTTIIVGALAAATKSAAVCTSEASKGVTFAFSDQGLHLTGRSSEYGESSVTCDIVSAGVTTHTKMDPIYLEQFLRPLDQSSTVSVEVVDSQSAVVLRCDEDYTGVIMPMADD